MAIRGPIGPLRGTLVATNRKDETARAHSLACRLGGPARAQLRPLRHRAVHLAAGRLDRADGGELDPLRADQLPAAAGLERRVPGASGDRARIVWRRDRGSRAPAA